MENSGDFRPSPSSQPKCLRTTDCLARRSRLVLLLLIAIGSLRIVSTYSVFSSTVDEPSHIARGIEWLDRGTYTFNMQHPPLSGVLVVILPYLAGARSAGKSHPFAEGSAILGYGRHYDRTLTLARPGTLPSYWLAMWIVYAWAFRLSGPLAAISSSLLFGALPAILAHSGLATTDMVLTASLGLAVLTTFWWLDKLSAYRSVVFGITIAFALLAKFSTVVFFPVGIMSMLTWYVIAHPDRVSELIRTTARLVRPSLIATVTAFFCIWMAYRFSLGLVHHLGVPLPAPEFFYEMNALQKHNSSGHPSYLLGRCDIHGFWYFYPVSLALKTPLGYLVLVGAALVLFLSRWRDAELALPLCFSGGILLFSMGFSNINIGIRHILPVYLGFSVAGGVVVAKLSETSQRSRLAVWIVAAALLWFLVSGSASHPDYLAYTNEIAPREPERYLVDSDLDWGQDVRRLVRRPDQLGVQEITFSPYSSTSIMAGRLSPIAHPTNYSKPAPGWNAISVSFWKIHPCAANRPIDGVPIKIADKPWPNQMKPLERVGRTILLYYFPVKASQEMSQRCQK